MKVLKEETEQAPSWKQDSILGQTVDFELYAQYGKPDRWMKEPRDLYLDCSCLNEYANYL